MGHCTQILWHSLEINRHLTFIFFGNFKVLFSISGKICGIFAIMENIYSNLCSIKLYKLLVCALFEKMKKMLQVKRAQDERECGLMIVSSLLSTVQ